jgi:hypothetical protein
MLSPMRALRSFVLLAALGTLVGPHTPISAGSRLPQEGHPLSGTWAGDWGAAEKPRTHLTVVMTWDGQTVSGLINPGPAAIPLSRVRVDWADWTVIIEAESKDAAGAPLAIRAEGRLEDVGSSRRRIVGIWSQAGTTGDFALRRE